MGRVLVVHLQKLYYVCQEAICTFAKAGRLNLSRYLPCREQMENKLPGPVPNQMVLTFLCFAHHSIQTATV